jgi:hypothetical protein
MKTQYSRRELYALGEPLGEAVTRKENGRVIYGGGGGGGPTKSEVTQTNIPEYARPYVETMLGAAQQQIFNFETDPKTGEMTPTSIKPYQPFSQDPNAYFAGFSPMQEQSFYGAANLGVSPEMGQAATATTDAMNRAMNTQYQTGEFGNQFQAPSAYQSSLYGPNNVSAQTLQNYQMQGPQDVQSTGYDAAEMGAAQTTYNPSLEQYRMGPAERVSTQSFAQPGSAEAYMSPYMQSVVDVQQREAQRQADIAGTQRGAQAVKSGAFGGSRQAIMEAEAARNLAQQKGDIQAQGLQSAYGQAQQQFNAEQQARLQAQQANQQAGLTVGGQNLGAQLGIQQLGTQTGLQTSLANLSSQQQANVQNQAARNQAMGMNAQQAMQAALANQQMGYNVGSQNLAANLGIQQLGSGQNLQAQLANQQMGLNAQQLYEQSRQFGAGQGMNAAQLSAQYGLAGQQAAEQSRQYGAGLNMQGLQTALSGAGQLGSIGQNIYGQQVGNIQLQNQLGGQQQALEQAKINQQVQDYSAGQQYYMMQLANMNNLLRGLPMQSTTTQTYQAPASPLSQGAGAAATAYGAYKTFGGAAGGQPKDFKKRPAGLAELALMKMQ